MNKDIIVRNGDNKMIDLWKVFEEEKRKAIKEKEALVEFYNKWAKNPHYQSVLVMN